MRERCPHDADRRLNASPALEGCGALPEQDLQPVSMIQEEDVPARRLLAHDLEHLTWDDDGETAVPPPD